MQVESPRWTYAAVASVDTDEKYQMRPRSCLHCLSSAITSRIFTRVVLLLVSVLLLANLAQLGSRRMGMPAEELDQLLDEIDWSRYAYSQYVTTSDYLCNSLMVFESLKRVGSRADRLMMFNEEWASYPEQYHHENILLEKAKSEYDVKLVPVHIQRLVGEETWAESFTKLLAFNQTQYARVLSLDADSNILQSMDELFLLPEAPVAMPRAYWITDKFLLSSQLVLIQPSEFEFNRILDAFRNRGENDFDMEIVNNIYGNNCFIIPHRRYDLLTGEYRATNHSHYLGSTQEVWNGTKILEEAKYLHFSDWPMPKPWLEAANETRESVEPACYPSPAGEMDCSDRYMWNAFYKEFRERRANICVPDQLPAPEEVAITAEQEQIVDVAQGDEDDGPG